MKNIDSYLIDNENENKKVKDTKICVIKWHLKFEDCKNCLEANQHEKETNHLKKGDFEVESLRENSKEIVKNIRLILKLQQKCKSVKHNVFIEVNKE